MNVVQLNATLSLLKVTLESIRSFKILHLRETSQYTHSAGGIFSILRRSLELEHLSAEGLEDDLTKSSQGSGGHHGLEADPWAATYSLVRSECKYD